MGGVSTHLPTADAQDPESSARTARLREALLAAAFTADGLLDLLGAPAYAALARSETVPALRATRGDSPLETLVRLFLLQRPVELRRARAALPVEDCLADGWLVQDGDELRAARGRTPVRRPRGAGLVDRLRPGLRGRRRRRHPGRRGGADRAQLVLGVGGASTTLAGITVRRPVAKALDLGTGSGIQALHAAQHATRVTATDLNPRALRIAALTLALSGARRGRSAGGLALRAGRRRDVRPDRVQPAVRDLAPGVRRGRLTYRDGGMGGDDLCRTLVQQSAAHLNDGGYCQLLANWQHVAGEEWHDRLRSWVPRGCDAWIVQREVQDITQYAELWLRDAGDHRADAGRTPRATTPGSTSSRRARPRPSASAGSRCAIPGPTPRPITVEEWPHPVEQPLGESVVGHFDRQDYLRATDDAALLAGHFRLADEVVQEQVGLPGAEDPEHVVLRQNRGMRRATKVDTVGAGFAGVCDGSLPAGRILDAIAQLVGEDPVLLRDRTPASIRMLVEQGFLEPVAAVD